MPSMNMLEFAGEVILVSLSGVLSPGPLFFANLIYGSKEGFISGIKIAFGHTIVELPLIILLAIGLSQIPYADFTSTGNLRIIGIVGGIAIVAFSILQIKDIIKGRDVEAMTLNSNSKKEIQKVSYNNRNRPIISGIIFTALNPFFLAWWLTVGLKLTSDSISSFGVLSGTISLFAFHIWMDYAWLTLVSYLIFKGISILKSKHYKMLLLTLSMMFGFYGLYWIITNLR
jgi:threonine/homoserine/homoserine lactone efflux protein